jgi:hypothetical protein
MRRSCHGDLHAGNLADLPIAHDAGLALLGLRQPMSKLFIYFSALRLNHEKRCPSRKEHPEYGESSIGQRDTVRPPSLRRADHRHDAGLDGLGQVGPPLDDGRQVGVDVVVFGSNCCAWRCAFLNIAVFSGFLNGSA